MQGGGTVGDRRVGTDDRVAVERVVVEHEVIVLHEEGDAGILCTGREEHAALTRFAAHGGDRVEATAAERGPGLRRQGCDRRTVDIAPAGRVRRSVAVAGAEELEHAVVKGEHAVEFGLLPPAVDEFGELLGVRCGEIGALRWVDRNVVQLPRVVVERGAGLVPSHRFPAVEPDAPVAAHLEVLDPLAARLVGAGERVAERGAADRHLFAAAVGVLGCDAARLVDGRCDVVDVVELVAEFAADITEALGPVHDERHMHATFMRVLLVPLERRVASLGPSPRIVGVAVRTTDFVEVVDGLLRRFKDAVEELHLMHDTERTTFLGGAVVGQHHHDGVVELPEVAQRVDQAPNLGVGVLEECGECFLEAGCEALVHLGHVVPCLDPGVAGRELGAFDVEAQLLLAGEPFGADVVPALVECPAVLVEVGLRCLVWCVGGAEGGVEEERAIGAHRHGVVHELDRLVDDVLADVVALIGALRRVDVVVVVGQRRAELVGLAVEEAIEAIKTPLQWPLVVGAGR